MGTITNDIAFAPAIKKSRTANVFLFPVKISRRTDRFVDLIDAGAEEEEAVVEG